MQVNPSQHYVWQSHSCKHPTKSPGLSLFFKKIQALHLTADILGGLSPSPAFKTLKTQQEDREQQELYAAVGTAPPTAVTSSSFESLYQIRTLPCPERDDPWHLPPFLFPFLLDFSVDLSCCCGSRGQILFTQPILPVCCNLCHMFSALLSLFNKASIWGNWRLHRHKDGKIFQNEPLINYLY